MKGISFLDVVCCALLTGVIVFKLQMGTAVEVYAQGRSAILTVDVLNPQTGTTTREEIGLKITHRFRGRETEVIDVHEKAVGKQKDVASTNGLVLLRPLTKIAEGGDPTAFDFQLSLPGRKGETVEVTIELPGHVKELAELANLLKESGLAVARDTMGEAQLAEIRASNAFGLSVLEGEDPWSALITDPTEKVDPGERWLWQNGPSVEWDYQSLVGGASAQELGVSERRFPREVVAFETLEKQWLELFRVASKGANKGTGSRNARAQVLALNVALHHYFLARKAEMSKDAHSGPDAKSKKLTPARLSEVLTDPHGVAADSSTVADLFGQVYLYLEAKPAPPGLGAKVLNVDNWPPPDRWETGYDKVGVYPCRLEDLLQTVLRNRDKGTLFDAAMENPRRTAMAHGPLFYQWAAWRCVRSQVRATLVISGVKYPIDLAELKPHAIKDGWIRYSFTVMVP